MAKRDVGAPIDANGNLTSDGSRTFEWDARNQLVAVTVGTHRSEFTYDGEQHRVRIAEKENGVTRNDMLVLWCDRQICEERAADGTTVTRRPFNRGEQAAVAGAPRFFAADHLGSVGAVTNAAGDVLARYGFDPWGRRMIAAGNDIISIGHTGHQWNQYSGLSLSLYRAYDPALGRWLSLDPLGFDDGPHLYAYVRNRATVLVDPLGLAGGAAQPCCDGKGGFTICWNQDVQNSTLRSCIEEHERDHIRFMEESPCRRNQCENRRKGDRTFTMTRQEHNDMECRGYRKEIDCLRRTLSSASSPGDSMRRIATIKDSANSRFKCKPALM